MDIDELDEYCMRVFGRSPDAIERPGGKSRKTAVIVLDNQKLVVSRRASPSRAALEAEVLRRLENTGHVPKLIRVDGAWLIQQHVSGKRLTVPLSDPASSGYDLLSAAVISLCALQAAATGCGLSKVAPDIGVRDGWLDELISLPQRVAELQKLNAPVLDTEAVKAAIAIRTPSFIKWDARPGNALVRADGSLCWFDWEHCGNRSAIDDMVWLLADEWSPEAPSIEALAIDSIAKRFSLGFGEVAEAFHTMAVFHSMVRISLVLHHRKNGPWWDHQACLEHDRVGVTQFHLNRLIGRAIRWSDEAAHLNSIKPLLLELHGKIMK